jgi:hypothetical protein
MISLLSGQGRQHGVDLVSGLEQGLSDLGLASRRKIA